jgi:hypothetical protein
MEFIRLTELGVGCILVRYAEIFSIEPTAYCFSRIQISTGTIKIVEEDPVCILNKIKLAQELTDAIDAHEERTAQKVQSWSQPNSSN